MNRRAKIIVSVTGIFIVLLALVGITYGYFLTQITDNDATRSIELTTANLELLYQDGNGVLTPAEKLLPGNDVKFKTSTGAVTTEKTFSVRNSGDDTEYVVIFENVEVTNVTTGEATTFESNDFRYTLTCTNGTTPCNGIEYDSFPMNGGVIVGNNIAKNQVQTYTLTMEYIETNTNQSNDMNKTISALINITDIKKENPYSSNKSSLAYNIINNSIKGTNGTLLVNTPPSKVAMEGPLRDWEKAQMDYYTYEMEDTLRYADEPNIAKYNPDGDAIQVTEETTCEDIKGKWAYIPSLDDSIYVSGCYNGKPYSNVDSSRYEKVLGTTQDDYGTSYYYRGNTKDNYVNFAGKCWRIVRIEGDGSIKLILDDQSTTCNNANYTGNWNVGSGHYGYTLSNGKYYPDYENGETDSANSMKTVLNNWLNNTSGIDKTKLKEDTWCLGDLTHAYSMDYEYTSVIKSYRTLINNSYNSLISAGNSFSTEAYSRLSLYNDNEEEYATLKCDEIGFESFSSHIGAINMEEYIHAGFTLHYIGIGYDQKMWLLGNNLSQSALTLSPYDFNGTTFNIFGFGKSQYQDTSTIQTNSPLRPVITLLNTAEISSGDGTKDKPYVIK